MDDIIKKIATDLYQKIDPDYFPDEDQMAEMLEECFKHYNVSLVNKVKEEQVPVLLRNSSESKRMRELAGIPHKGNFL